MLPLMPHEMIKRILLPEAAMRSKSTIDLRACVVLPGFALFQHRRLVGKAREQMHMIGHDHKADHLITITIEVPQAVMHDPGDLRPLQHAFPMPGVQFLVPAGGEAVVILHHLVHRQLLHA